MSSPIRPVRPPAALNHRSNEIRMCCTGTTAPRNAVCLLSTKAPVPSSQHNQTGQISSSASYSWQEPKTRELGLSSPGLGSDFRFSTLLSRTHISLGLERAGSATTGLLQVGTGRAAWEKLLQSLCGCSTALPDAITGGRSWKEPKRLNYYRSESQNHFSWNRPKRSSSPTNLSLYQV